MAEEQISAQHKKAVAERARYCCEYCLSQAAYSPDPFSIDHIIPRIAGGTNDLENLAFACLGCNNRKFTSTSALDPVTGLDVLLYHPRRHPWHDHFMWDNDSRVGRLNTNWARHNRATATEPLRHCQPPDCPHPYWEASTLLNVRGSTMPPRSATLGKRAELALSLTLATVDPAGQSMT